VIGVFDGVHLGHQYLISQATSQAESLAVPLLITTFDRDPDELFFPEKASRKLLSDSERLTRLGLAGFGGVPSNMDTADNQPTGTQPIVLALPFNEELAGLSPDDFLNQVLLKHCTPLAIHVGADFRFGNKASGDVSALNKWATAHGAQVFGHHLLDDGGKPITATRIRDCLSSGNLEEANRLLTRPHHISGTVVRGRGFGRDVGFPTANIAATSGVMLPADGVYAGFLECADDLLPAAISVGVPLTFEGVEATVEAYVLDYEGNLYDSQVTIYFVERLRPMIAFASVAELSNQIGKDVKRSRAITASARSMLE
jgi:riboflavin kinase/FMN adenylyltransferase